MTSTRVCTRTFVIRNLFKTSSGCHFYQNKMISIKVLAISLVILPASTAVKWWGCPKHPLQENFEIEKYAGKFEFISINISNQFFRNLVRSCAEYKRDIRKRPQLRAGNLYGKSQSSFSKIDTLQTSSQTVTLK